MTSKNGNGKPHQERDPRQEQRTKAVAGFEKWCTRAKKSTTPAAKRLTDEEVNRLVHELR
ncbi:MAG TPA: hypothetical protein VGS02_08395 [Acidobacteriaceae bacterium]|nr:hypothetical protein [Acidobacteriaceae bacterium]